MEFTERSHSIVTISKLLDSSISKDVLENVRLLKSHESGMHYLIVLDKFDDNPLLYDLTKNLRRKETRFEIVYVTREELAKITDAFDVAKTLDDTSEVQAKIINIIKTAVELRASDIHFLILQNMFKVAFRIDGIKRNITQFEDTVQNGKTLVQSLYNSMCDERSTTTLNFKDPSDAKIREEFVSEFGLSTGRFASRPGSAGSLIAVIRLVSKRKELLELDALGLSEKQVLTLRKALSKPYGVIFSSGPTGHGKSTLSQCMAETVTREDSGINLITVEDPIESPISGAVQTPLIIADRSDRQRMGMAWASAITNLMRLDPDFIYIGEVRDITSATGVIEAAQTGHNVITTIHTSHPIDIIERLSRLGVEKYLLTDETLITCLIGLRLTPLLCPKCKLPYASNSSNVESEVRSRIEKHINVSEAYIINSNGCDCCNHTGIKGRTGVFEVIETNGRFMQLYEQEGKLAAWKYWHKSGGETLCESLLTLINKGVVDPVSAHKKICNLDRDEILNE